MHIARRRDGAVSVIRPTGPLVFDEMEELDGVMTDLTLQWERRVLINLEDVTFVDSAGLELLLRYQEKLQDYGAKLKLCHLNDINRKILEITRLERLFDIYPDVAMAVKSFI